MSESGFAGYELLPSNDTDTPAAYLAALTAIHATASTRLDPSGSMKFVEFVSGSALAGTEWRGLEVPRIPGIRRTVKQLLFRISNDPDPSIRAQVLSWIAVGHVPTLEQTP